MSWLTEYVRPKIRTLLGRREMPDNLWQQCPACQQMIFSRDLDKNLKVCPQCGHHMRATAAERLAWTFDPVESGPASFSRIELPKVPADPLRFRDSKRYTDRLREAREKTGMDDALLVAHGPVGGQPCVVAAMDFNFIGGSMGAAVGEGIVAAARLAVLKDAPLIVYCASGGARMMEGAVSLMQMPRTIIATQMVKEAGLPFLVVLTDPTTGGVTASFAMLGDIQIAEPGAMIGFAGARVIEQTVRETLPEGFQRAEYLLEHGILDMVVNRGDLRETLARIISLLRVKRIDLPTPPAEIAEAAALPEALAAPALGAEVNHQGAFGLSIGGPRSVDPIIARLHALHPRLIDLSLERVLLLLERLGRPQDRLPPVIHVAGTNGKGSTCAFLRAMAEAAGGRVHVYTSPHLVHWNERIRLAGTLVTDAQLAEALEEVERVNDGAPITVFEVNTAVALYLFAREPADLCVLEVGLGGRFDATNVVDRPAACAITSISLDHQEFLGDTLAAIAFEKAGIIKPGRPVAVGQQPEPARAVLARQAAALGAPLLERGRDWQVEQTAGGLRYQDGAGTLDLPPPSLAGPFQYDNAGIAITALRAAGLALPDTALAGIAAAAWPARLQRLHGKVAALLPAGWELWLDGGHNPGAGAALADFLRGWADRPLHMIVGMKQSKDAAGFLAPLLPLAQSVWAVAEPGQHMAWPVEGIIAASGGIARPGPTVASALATLARDFPPGRVLICGTLYLAGEVLKADLPA